MTILKRQISADESRESETIISHLWNENDTHNCLKSGVSTWLSSRQRNLPPLLSTLIIRTEQIHAHLEKMRATNLFKTKKEK